jgi:hypothetical protein
MEVNKFVAELKSNPRFMRYAPIAEMTAAKVFGTAFEKYYDADTVDTYRRANPHHIKYMMQHANVLIDSYNNSLRGNSVPRPMFRLDRAGEVNKSDIERLEEFFKLHGKELAEYMVTGKNVPKDNSIFYFKRLRELSDSGALSYMTDSDSNASLYINNMTTPERGSFEKEKGLGGEGYLKEGIAFFTDPRNKTAKLNMIEL